MANEKGYASRPLIESQQPIALRFLGRLVYWMTTVGMAISAIGVLVALALISYSVISRYLLGAPSLWIDGVIGFLLVAIVMFGASAALREGRHLGVDLFTGKLEGRTKHWAEAWSMAAVLVVAGYLIVDGWQTAMFSRMIGITTHGYVEFPMYWIQMLIPVGGIMLGLAALEALGRIACGFPAHAGAESDEQGDAK